jgi:hypothetical protein
MKMEQRAKIGNKPNKNLRYYMRFLHNNIGFFIVGLVVIYSLSGIIQIYRDTTFLKHEVLNEKKLSPNLEPSQLKDALRLRDFAVEKTVGNIVYFKNGTYNSATGIANYITQEWYSFIAPFTELHKASSKNAAHYFTTIFGILLLFMSVSAFWMFKPGTRLFSRGVYMTVAGIIVSMIILFL